VIKGLRHRRVFERLAVQRVVFGFIRRGEEMLALHAQGDTLFLLCFVRSSKILSQNAT